MCDGPGVGLSAVAARLAAQGAPSPVPAMAWPAGRTTSPAADDAAAEQLVTTVRDLDVGFALADSRTAWTSDFTKTANSTAWPLYCLVATGGGPARAAYDGHPGGRAAYLRVRGPTRPRRLLVVIVQHARGLSLFCAADRAGADSVVLGLERDMPNTDGLRRLPCPSFASWRRPSALIRASSCSCPWSRRVFYVARARAYGDAPRTPQQRSGDGLGNAAGQCPPRPHS